jgi:hypothetical protein
VAVGGGEHVDERAALRRPAETLRAEAVADARPDGIDDGGLAHGGSIGAR